jgi:ribonuclease E
MVDAPQPADDGLAAVAEIGGDFAVPAPGRPGEEGEEIRSNGSRRRRSRRGRRGERDRFAPLEPESTAPEFEPEASAFDPETQPPLETAPEPAPEQPELPWSEPTPAPAPQPSLHSEEPTQPSEPAPEDPARPRRSGWWQRARATLVGD